MAIGLDVVEAIVELADISDASVDVDIALVSFIAVDEMPVLVSVVLVLVLVIVTDEVFTGFGFGFGGAA